MIIGPYKQDGNMWGCDRDVCNGNFIDGSYVYVGSGNFPYVVGCWGPGPDPSFAPTCTNGGCDSRGTSVLIAGQDSINSNSTGGTDETTGEVSGTQNQENNDFAAANYVSSVGIFAAAISALSI